MDACVSCLHAKRTRGRSAFRQVRNGTTRCAGCGGAVCKLHSNRADGETRCRECAQAQRRDFADRIRWGTT